MKRAILFCGLLAWGSAHADLVTEIGGGIKFNESAVLDPRCRQVVIYDARGGFAVDSDTGNPTRSAPCGGDNPAFIGWPLAWDFPQGLRFGWFHYSNLLDGRELSHLTSTGDRFETSLNCLCFTKAFHWGHGR